MAESRVPFKIVRGGRTFELQFMLEPAWFNHRLIHACISKGRAYEPVTSELLCRVLQPGDTFVDIGAHIGYFTLLASRMVGPRGRVVSFEAESSNYQQLLRHLRINRADNVEPHHRACGNQPGVVTFEVVPAEWNDGAHSLAPRPAKFNAGVELPRQETYVTTLDAMFPSPRQGMVKAIKMDVEGWETRVLQGGLKFLRDAQVPVVVIENNATTFEMAGTSETELRALMTRLGYQTFAEANLKRAIIPLKPGIRLRARWIYNFIFLQPSIVPFVTQAMKVVDHP